MSSVDNRVVQMEFNNKRFESNVSTTLSTLDKLKKALHFGDEADGLDRLQESSQNFDLNHMSRALDNISNKFTLLGQVGWQAMERIATAAVNAGTQLVKSISVDQISAGMSKYEQETNSVQAIYAAVKRKGKSLDDVYASLDQLAEYSDETSYSYTQMVDGASKFIANGIDMDVAVKSMMGIANAAAQGGVSIQDASYAFKNFSDAMSSGHFMIKDWQSIQNIHMDTELFKNEVIASAKALGKLDAEGRVIDQATGKVKDTVLTIENFRDNLRYGFFDTEVMLDVLGKYADFDWDRVYSGEFKTMGDEAAAMAQQAKTFTDVLGAVQDAASTGWKQSFRYIFGNLEEAIDFFTPMANNIIGVVQEIAEARNLLLSDWRDAGGRDSMIGTLRTIWETFLELKSTFTSAASYIWGSKSPFGALISGNILADVSKGFQTAAESFRNWINGIDTEGGGNRMMKLTGIIRGLVSVVDFFRQILSGIWSFGKNIFQQLIPSFDAVLSFFSSVGRHINRAMDSIRASGVIPKIANKIADAFKPITSRLPGLIRGAQQLFQNTIKFVQTNPKIQRFRKVLGGMFRAFIDFVPTAIDGAIEFGKSLWSTITASDEWKWVADKYNRYIKPLGDKFLDLGTLLSHTIKRFFSVDTSGESGLWNKLKKRLSVFENLGPWFEQQWAALKKKFPILQKVEDWWNASSFVAGLKEWTGTIGKAIDQFFGTDTSGETSLIGKLKKRVEAFTSVIGPFLQEQFDGLKARFPFIQQIQDFFERLFPKKDLSQSEESVSKGFNILDLLKSFLGKVVEIANSIGLGKIIALGMLLGTLWNVFQILNNGKWVLESVAGFFEQLSGGGYYIRKARNFLSVALPVAATLWLLTSSLQKVAQLNIYQIVDGLIALGGLFAEEGAFIYFMNTMASVKHTPLKFGTLIGIGLSITLLTNSLSQIANLNFDQIANGLIGLGGLFAEEGAFIYFVNNFAAVKHSPLKFGALIGIGLSIALLTNSLSQIANLNFDQIANGLIGLGGLFAEEGAFIYFMNNFAAVKHSPLHFGMLIGIGLSIGMLVNSLSKVASMDFNSIINGLIGLGGLFAEEGAFIYCMNTMAAVKYSPLKFGTLLGIGLSIGMLVNSLSKVAAMDFDSIINGLIGLGGLFAEEGAFIYFMNTMSVAGSNPLGFGTLLGIGTSIALLTNSLSIVASLEIGKIIDGLIGLAGLFAEEGVFMLLMQGVSGLGGGAIVSMLAIGLFIKALTDAMNSTKDLSVGQMLAFFGAMLILSVAMIPLTAVMTLLSGLGIGGALKGAIGMVLVFGALSLGIAMLGSAVTSQISAFGSAMAELGAAMATFSEITGSVDAEQVKAKLGLAKEMATAGTEIAMKSYGGLDSFNTMISRLGAGIWLFSATTNGIDISSKQQLITDLVKMATDLSGISEVGDVSETIANIGAAIKLYGENVEGVKLDKVPDSAKIAEIFAAIQESAASSLTDSSLAGISGYATEESAGTLTQFALGLTNITTAFADFSKSVENVEFGSIETAIANLDNLAGLTSKLSEKSTIVTDFGAFSVTVTNESGNLTTFSEDIKLLGTALSDFGTQVGGVDMSAIQQGSQVLDEMAVMAGKLPKEGGIEQWYTGTSSLTKFAGQIRILGINLKSFNESITSEGFDIEKVKKGIEVIGVLVDANAKLPELGGLKAWFVGEQSFSAFSSGLGALGDGVKQFATEFGDTTISDSMTRALKFIDDLVDMQIKLSSNTGLGDSLVGYSSTWATTAQHFKDMNATMSGITKFANLKPLQDMVDWTIKIDSKLSTRKSTTQLHDFFQDYQEMIKDIKWIGDHTGDFKIDEANVTSIVSTLSSVMSGVSDSIGNSIMSAMAGGMENQNGTVETAAGTVASNAVTKLRGYNSAFSNAGTYMMQGLAGGIYSSTDLVVRAIETVADKTVNAFNRKLTIESPSRVFAQSGRYIVEGLSNGINGSSGQAGDASEMLGQGVIDRMNEVLGIHSPSTVARAQGENYTKGFGEGMSDPHYIQDEVEQTAKNITSGLEENLESESNSLFSKAFDKIEETANDVKDAILPTAAYWDLVGEFPMPTDGSMTMEEYNQEILSRIDDKIASYGLDDSSGSGSGSGSDSGSDSTSTKKSGGGSGSGSGSSSSSSSSVGSKDYSTDLMRILAEEQVINDRLEKIMSDLSEYFSYQYTGGTALDTPLATTIAGLLDYIDMEGYTSSRSSDVSPVVSSSDLDRYLGGTTTSPRFDTSELNSKAQAAVGSIDYTPKFDEVISELQSLNERVDQMADMFENLQIVLDTGELVGVTAGSFDGELGRRIGYANRGIGT